MSNDQAQMLIWETIFFAATVILAILFLYQLSPVSLISTPSAYDLKIQGDDALYSLYNDVLSGGQYPDGYPSSKLVHYLITNGYGSVTAELNTLLPTNILYNIYIANKTATVLWCNSKAEWTMLPENDPVFVSHCLVAMNVSGLSQSAGYAWFYNYSTTYRFVDSSHESDLLSLCVDDTDVFYDVRLVMWYI